MSNTHIPTIYYAIKDTDNIEQFVIYNQVNVCSQYTIYIFQIQ